MLLKTGKNQVTFVYHPHSACDCVHVVGTFNDWQPENGKMTRQKDGSYRKRLSLPPGEYRYKFFVDGHWVEDDQADGIVINEFGTHDSLVTVA